MKHFLAFLLLAVPITRPFQLKYKADGTGAVERFMSDKEGDFVSVKDFGCIGDGSTDDTTCIQSAVTAAGGKTLYFPRPATSYKITDTINVSTANTRLFGDGSKIKMALASNHSTGRLFYVTASNIEFDNLWIDSTGTSATTTGNKYGIQAIGSSGTHLTDVRVRNCQLTNLPWADVGSVLSTHAVYAQWVDRFTVEQNKFDAPSGAAVFMSAVTAARIINNNINDTGWYSIQMNDLVDGALIAGNRITGTTSGSRNWGGSVNLMSNSTTGTACGSVGCARIKNVNITNNYISGVHSYTAAIHIESSSYVNVTNNIFRDISLTDATPPDFVRVYVRPAGGTTNEGPNDHIDISDNLMVANGVSNIAVYADAQDNGSGSLTYSDALIVARNRIVSIDTSNYIAKAVIVHGQQGGWKNISILDNVISGFPNSSSPVSGLVGSISSSGVPNLDVLIRGNNLTVIGGTPSSTTHLGIAIDAYTQRVQVFGNSIGTFWDGIRTFTNSSSIQVFSNSFATTGNTDYTFGVAPSVPTGTLNRYGSLFLTGRGSDLAGTSVVATAGAGEYRLCATARTTTSGTGTTANLNLIWTDEGGVKTDAVGTWALNSVTVTGQINKCEYIHAAASTNIQVSVTAGTYGTSLYAISATAEKLN